MNIRNILAVSWLGVLGISAACSGEDGSTGEDCGNGKVEGAEACDGADLGGNTCESLGFGAGVLSCATSCGALDTSKCGAPATCGNGKKDGVESCDGSDLGGQTCADLGLGSGTLGCTLTCTAFDAANCSGPASCGNGKKDGAEACDGADLGSATCESVGIGSGTLACQPNCVDFDTSGCVCVPACGGLECGLDSKCGQSCGECAVGWACETNQCIEICDLPPIVSSATLNLDAKTVTLTGTVLLNGAQMPNDAKIDNVARGVLRFWNIETGDEYLVPLGETGAANYSVTLFAGKYEIDVRGNAFAVQSVLPAGKTGQLKKEIEITTGGPMDFDAKTVALSGKVTLNGAEMPNDSKIDGVVRGNLRFWSLDTGDEYLAPLGETGPANYTATIWAGNYHVDVRANAFAVQSVLPAGKTGRIQKGVAFSTSGTKDFDAKTVALTGNVTLNGADMPNDGKLDGVARGNLRFWSQDTGDEYLVALGETGPASYTETIWAGVYEVDVRGNAFAVQSVLPAGKTGLIQKDVAFATSGPQNFDARTATLTGEVKLNGAQMPNDAKIDGVVRGNLRFWSQDTGDEYLAALGETGPANYTATVWAGNYEIDVRANAFAVQSVLPAGKTGRIQKDLVISSSTMMSFDAKTATLTGEVKLNGAQMPNDGKIDGVVRGNLRFWSRDTGDEYLAALGETGPANYTATVWAGNYEIDVRANAFAVQSVLPAGKTGMLVKEVALTTNATTNFDAKTPTITGTVTLNGQQVPNDGKIDGVVRANLIFRDLHTGDEYLASLGETGAANYTTTLFAGSYDVDVRANAFAVQSVFPPGMTERLLNGCSQ